MSKYNLFTEAKSNAKTAKNDSSKYLSVILHLAPATLAGIEGFNACPAASNGCKAACLNTAGRGGMFKKGETTNTIQQARIRRTRLFVNEHETFINLLVTDLIKLRSQANKLGLIPVARLNGTSDIDFENISITRNVARNKIKYKNLFKMFPEIVFYDYSKRPDRVIKYLKGEYPSNYSLTFSRSEINDNISMRLLKAGANVAMVFKDIPEQYNGFKVVNGDLHDLRFLDPKNVVVALKAKGKAKKDSSGFVIKGVA